MAMNPVPKPEVWDITDYVHNRVILPWKKKRLTGRPKKNQTLSVGEKRKQQTCGNCGRKRHNKKSCRNPSRSTEKPTKKPRTCTVCKKEGHNKLKCPDRDNTPDLSLAPYLSFDDTDTNTDDEEVDCQDQICRQRIANAEDTIHEERANAGRLTADNAVLMAKVENLEAEIINLHVQMEARDNELNVLYTLIEKMQKKMLDFNIPPSP
ncbi:hypothetical protein Dsin_012571 [Dipteronia sinensis]|uniref:CCHC-type domain-containing protein n=1 Tax=Dipteronia sinensis TaxID=43782 RepID=A0AAE0E860_9ROSI|nr:hypothetical protein Dsin_012571 [Dipteronia sinensis]